VAGIALGRSRGVVIAAVASIVSPDMSLRGLYWPVKHARVRRSRLETSSISRTTADAASARALARAQLAYRPTISAAARP